MGNRITRVMIETALRKALKEIDEAPERTMRNLIDMALNVSNGRYQKEFFETAQKLLENEESQYYDALRSFVKDVEHERLITMGMNVGYNTCVSGSETIRKIEAEKHFNIPWALFMKIDGARSAEYREVLQEGQQLGIYTYLIFISGDAETALDLAKEFPECAFVLFCEPKSLTQKTFDKAEKVNNAMFALKMGEMCQEIVREAKRRKLFYALYISYSENDVPEIVSGRILEEAAEIGAPFILFSSGSCPKEARDAVCKYVSERRMAQDYPAVLMEIYSDSLAIDAVISDDACAVCFDCDGELILDGERKKGAEYNILENELESILKIALPKGEWK